MIPQDNSTLPAARRDLSAVRRVIFSTTRLPCVERGSLSIGAAKTVCMGKLGIWVHLWNWQPPPRA